MQNLIKIGFWCRLWTINRYKTLGTRRINLMVEEVVKQLESDILLSVFIVLEFDENSVLLSLLRSNCAEKKLRRHERTYIVPYKIILVFKLFGKAAFDPHLRIFSRFPYFNNDFYWEVTMLIWAYYHFTVKKSTII